jgi:Tfp pilus tip-associated adhesin PilY1
MASSNKVPSVPKKNVPNVYQVVQKENVPFSDETTTGTMAVVDLDGDGFVEIVSAGYTVGKVYVHTFAPE